MSKVSKEGLDQITRAHKDFDGCEHLGYKGRLCRPCAVNKYVMGNLLDTIAALHEGINTLADQYEAQGRYAEARDVRGLGE